ncbi:MAG: hypothetical protein WA369_12250 [Candidatus Acidiferrales bacterium]
MNHPFDIFQMLPVDRVLWRGTAGSLEEARTRVREMAGGAPGRYLVLCVQTGTGLVVNSECTNSTETSRLANGTSRRRKRLGGR